MMLFKLSIKNIKKSFKDYAIYFVTLILGVAIFYVFNAIESQTVMMDVTASTREIITLMTNMLSGVSVFVSLILGFLIIYASRFLIKRRNKEFGIYLTLGMSKRKISMILFIETLLIGLVSLGVGLGLGVLLSQLMSLLVANMFEADFTKFTFVFSKSACIKTLGYFSIMYIIVMIFNTINVGKCKLIDLLYASKKSEKNKIKKSSYLYHCIYRIGMFFRICLLHGNSRCQRYAKWKYDLYPNCNRNHHDVLAILVDIWFDVTNRHVDEEPLLQRTKQFYFTSSK